ncbi:hypothetical protein EV368DRAFT_67056 [Lentinula lateritia]|nr:hypothetical protein EV368DRAFT_67056 [Lentinula lateritia]
MPAVRGTSLFHTNVEAPFICAQCGTRTSRKADLRRHEKIHTGVRHQCPHEGCKFSTPQRSNLNTHLGLHDPSRKRTCPDCAFCCNDPSSLIRHRKSKHSYVPQKYSVAEQPSKFLPPEGPSPNALSTTLSCDLPPPNFPQDGSDVVAYHPLPPILYQTPTRLAPRPGAKDVVGIAAPPAPSLYLPSKDYEQTPLSTLPFPFAEYPCAADFPPDLSAGLPLLGPWQGSYSENPLLPHSKSQYFESFNTSDTGNDIAAGQASQVDFGVGSEMGLQMANKSSVGMEMNANRRLTPAPPLVPALSMGSIYGPSYRAHQAPSRRSNIWESVGQDYNENPGAGPSMNAYQRYC